MSMRPHTSGDGEVYVVCVSASVPLIKQAADGVDGGPSIRLGLW